MFAVTSERKGMGQTEGGEKKKNKMVCREEAVKGMKGKKKYVKEMTADKDSVCVNVRERGKGVLKVSREPSFRT